MTGITLLWQQEAVSYLIFPLGSQQYWYSNKIFAAVVTNSCIFLSKSSSLRRPSFAEMEQITSSLLVKGNFEAGQINIQTILIC